MRLLMLTFLVLAVAGCFGTEVGNPGLDPDGGADAAVTGLVPVGAAYRPDAFFECLRFHEGSGAFVGLDYLVPSQVYGETFQLDLEVRNECDEALRLADWGTTDERFSVVLDTAAIPPGGTATSSLSVAFAAAAPAGALDQRVAIRIAGASTTDDRVITFLGWVHAGCDTLPEPDCRARATCSWDEAATTCR